MSGPKSSLDEGDGVELGKGFLERWTNSHHSNR